MKYNAASKLIKLRRLKMSNKLLDKIESLKLRSWSFEVAAIVETFHAILQQHFDAVDAKAKKLIDNRWNDEMT
jgi:hypothetical protein